LGLGIAADATTETSRHAHQVLPSKWDQLTCGINRCWVS
jgi:hypothetical protein